MTYLILGETSLINKEINNIINKYNINFNSVIKYDLEESSVNKAIEELNTISLFNELKVVVLSNIKLLEEDEMLINYLKNQNENILIITSSELLNERKKITKVIKENSKVIDLLNFDLNKYIKNELSDYKINNITIMLIIDYCNNDYMRIKNEIDKLKMLKLEEKEITEKDVKENIKRNLNSNIFLLIDSLNKKDKTSAFKILYELISLNEDPIKILITLANNYRLIYRVKELMEECNDQSIMELLEIKSPYRLKKLKEQSYFYDDEKLLLILKDLSELDIKIKTGKTDSKTAIEMFLSKV